MRRSIRAKLTPDAVLGINMNGEVLEGKGVERHIYVTDEFLFADGHHEQLAKSIGDGWQRLVS